MFFQKKKENKRKLREKLGVTEILKRENHWEPFQNLVQELQLGDIEYCFRYLAIFRYPSMK